MFACCCCFFRKLCEPFSFPVYVLSEEFGNELCEVYLPFIYEALMWRLVLFCNFGPTLLHLSFESLIPYI
jgi:hypothetical protein